MNDQQYRTACAIQQASQKEIDDLRTQLAETKEREVYWKDKYEKVDKYNRVMLGQLDTAQAQLKRLGEAVGDAEIQQVAIDEAQQDWNDLRFKEVFRDGFVNGAKWMKGKLKQAMEGREWWSVEGEPEINVIRIQIELVLIRRRKQDFVKYTIQNSSGNVKEPGTP